MNRRFRAGVMLSIIVLAVIGASVAFYAEAGGGGINLHYQKNVI